jgi:archaemetzincin
MAYYEPRNRYRAEKLLVYLDSIRDRSHTKILGLTSKDISTTKGEYLDWGIFGLGSINGHPCIVSTYRLKKGKQGERLLTKRLVDVVNHELGHTFGFKHCPNTGCLMEDGKGTIKTVDNSNGKFCEKCRRRLDIILGLSKTRQAASTGNPALQS